MFQQDTVARTHTHTHIYSACVSFNKTLLHTHIKKNHFNPQIISNNSEELRVKQTAAPAAVGGWGGGHLRQAYLSR